MLRAIQTNHDGFHFRRGDIRVLPARNWLRGGMYTAMTPVELVLGSVMAIALTVYLVYAMLRPEKF